MFPETATTLASADLCVKCGLCLPHCPTYRLTAHEAQGPRGRIALAQGLLSGTLPASANLSAHLDGCLSCRACEAVCPAKVPYGRVLDRTRAILATPTRTRMTRVIGRVLEAPVLRALLRLALWLSSAMLDRTALPASTPLRKVAHAMPRLLRYRPMVHRLGRVLAPQHAKIALFTGCVGDIAERSVLHDTLRLLQAAGIEAAIPTAQGCCGALYQHGGLPDRAGACANRNAHAFAGSDTVLALATGCGAALRDLGRQATDHAPALAPKVRDLCTALAEALDAQPPRFSALPKRVGIHTACTQANVFSAGGAIRRLLARIPGIELIDLAPESGCCGAAGTGFISHPAQADALRAPKLAAAAAVDMIVSANIGCSLHLLAGLRQQSNREIHVLHPVSLLAQLLEN